MHVRLSVAAKGEILIGIARTMMSETNRSPSRLRNRLAHVKPNEMH